jgi:predicted aspartyl protease
MRHIHRSTGIHWLLFLGLLLPVPATRGAQPRRSTNLAALARQLGFDQIELRRSGENRLFLFGKLDGRKRSVLVDTGWSFTTISPTAAAKLKIQRKPELQVGNSHPGTKAESPALLIGNLDLARVAFTNQPALVQEMVFNGQRAPFDVVVGCDFLIRNCAVIDCSNRRLYTRHEPPSKEQQAELENALRQSGFLPVDLKRTINPLALTCPARLNGEPVELLVDTGAVWSCLDTDLAKSLGVKLLPTPRQITGAGTTGKRGFEVARLDSVQLGGVEVRNQNFAALHLGDWGLAASGGALAEVGGILGGPELAAWNAIIDCHGLKMWLKPPSARAPR